MDLLAKRNQAAALVRTGLAKGPDQETLLALSLAVEMDLQESGPAVQALLLHPNPRIRCRAALCLGRLGYGQAGEEMERLLAGQPDEPMARALICGLGLMGRTEALPALVPFLAHFRDLVRVDAASALAALGSSQGLDLVLEGSRSPDRLVRLEAVYGLRFFREAEARARLEELCLDPGEIWKREARVSLAAWELAGIGDAAGAPRRLPDRAAGPLPTNGGAMGRPGPGRTGHGPGRGRAARPGPGTNPGGPDSPAHAPGQGG